MSELLDVLILEDQQTNRDRIAQQIHPSIRHQFVCTSLEFQKFLADGQRARNYFLDNQVRHSSGRLEYMFLEHFALLREHDSDGKVFYIGNDPTREEREFCEDQGIMLIDRSIIGRTAREHY